MSTTVVRQYKEGKGMFKRFIQRIIAAENQSEAWEYVFYGEDGIEMAYQLEKISWKEYDMLCSLIGKMA